MPYNMKGEDSPTKTGKMERCVEKLVKKGKSKEAAIRICKSSMEKGEEKED